MDVPELFSTLFNKRNPRKTLGLRLALARPRVELLVMPYNVYDPVLFSVLFPIRTGPGLPGFSFFLSL
jgi:hypothetical protein